MARVPGPTEGGPGAAGTASRPEMANSPTRPHAAVASGDVGVVLALCSPGSCPTVPAGAVLQVELGGACLHPWPRHPGSEVLRPAGKMSGDGTDESLGWFLLDDTGRSFDPHRTGASTDRTSATSRHLQFA